MLRKAASPQLLPRCTTQGANKCEASTRFAQQQHSSQSQPTAAQAAFGAANSHVMAAPFSQLLNFELGGPGGAGDGGKIYPNFQNFEVTRGERSWHRRRRSRSSRHQQAARQAHSSQPAQHGTLNLAWVGLKALPAAISAWLTLSSFSSSVLFSLFFCFFVFFFVFFFLVFEFCHNEATDSCCRAINHLHYMAPIEIGPLPPCYRSLAAAGGVMGAEVFPWTSKFATSKSMFCARFPSLFITSHKMPRLPRNLHVVTTSRSPDNEMDGCERLRTVANDCQRKRNVERTHPQPPDPQSETRTLATHSAIVIIRLKRTDMV